MKVIKRETETYHITDVVRLDPVTAYVTNFSSDAGKITIDCFGKAWSCYWAAMGSRTLQEFFISCDNDYILNALLSGNTMQTDFDEIEKLARQKGISISGASDVEIAMQADDMTECFGDDWYMDLPTCHTSDYNYVGRMVDAIREAFKEEMQAKAA